MKAMLQLTRRLHAREEVEPSGILGDALTQAFRPNHDKLRLVLCREMGLSAPDIDIDRLAFSIVGMASIARDSLPEVDEMVSYAQAEDFIFGAGIFCRVLDADSTAAQRLYSGGRPRADSSDHRTASRQYAGAICVPSGGSETSRPRRYV